MDIYPTLVDEYGYRYSPSDACEGYNSAQIDVIVRLQQSLRDSAGQWHYSSRDKEGRVSVFFVYSVGEELHGMRFTITDDANTVFTETWKGRRA